MVFLDFKFKTRELDNPKKKKEKKMEMPFSNSQLVNFKDNIKL